MNFQLINLAGIEFGQLQQVVGLKPGLENVGGIISELLKYLFVFAGLALLLYLIFGGFQIMTSGGDPGKMKEARAIVTNAIVGFLIIFVAYWLIQAMGIIFGIEEIKQIFQ